MKNLNFKNPISAILFLLIIFLFPITSTQTDSINENHNEDEFSNKLNSLWEDFNSEFYYTFLIEPGKSYEFIQEVVKLDSKLKGLYMCDEKSDVNFEMEISIEGNSLFKSNQLNDVFKANLPKRGNYKLTFYNKSSSERIKISLLLNSGQNELLKSSQLETTHEKIRSLDSYIKTLLNSQEFRHHRFRERVKVHDKNNQYMLIYSVIETLILIQVTIFQFKYMNKLLKAKENIFN